MSSLIVKNLVAGYNNINVLKSISIHIKKGEIVTLIGGNGAGKTTFLSTISGLIPALEGEILFQGKKINKLLTKDIVRLGIVMVPENRDIFNELSVGDNLLLGSFIFRKRKYSDKVQSRFKMVYELFPILEKKRLDLAGTLSGGEQQMLAIGRALMSFPKLLLLDEPSLGLAPKLVHDIFQTLKMLKAKGTTILLVEQNAKLALSIADYGYVLETGLIITQGKSSELIENKEVKRAYLGKDFKKITDR